MPHLTHKQRQALANHRAMHTEIGGWRSSLSGIAYLRRIEQEKTMKKQHAKISVFKAHHQGWMQKDPKRIEHYHTVLNDLAEGIRVGERLSPASLAEVIGYLQREQQFMNDHMNHIHGEMLILAADSIMSRMKRRWDSVLPGNEQQRPSTVGGNNPVETTINPVQQPARPGPGLPQGDQKGQPVDAGGQPKQRRPKQALHGGHRTAAGKRTRQRT